MTSPRDPVQSADSAIAVNARWRRQLPFILGAIVIFALALQQNYRNIDQSQYHPDESRWLNRAVYTKAILHPFSSTWEDRYLTRGQPPGGSFVTGLGLLLQGRDLDANQPWVFERGDEKNTWWNAAHGAMPAWDELYAARRTSVILGAVSALALYLIVAHMTNIAGGLVAGGFFAIHPLSTYLSTLAVSDAAFTTMVALSTLAAMAFARKPTWTRTVLLSLMLGAGASTKLSPLFLGVALGGIGVAFALVPVLERIPGMRAVVKVIPGWDSTVSRAMSWKLIAVPVMTGLIFFLSYPFLWPAPLARTKSLFEFRQHEMNNQARIWPQSSVDSRTEALHRTWNMLEGRFSSTGRLYSEVFDLIGKSRSRDGIDVILALLGLAIVLVLAWSRGVTSTTFFGLALAGGQAALIIGGMRVDFDRYYLPIVFLFAIGVGVAGGAVWSLLKRLVSQRTPVQTPPMGLLQRRRSAAGSSLIPEPQPSSSSSLT